MWYVGLPLGTLTAGLVQAGTTKSLEGVHGLAGWRWMYIICAIITIPVGILGYFVVPGTIDQPNPYIFKEKDLVVARKRLDKAGHTLQGRLRFRHVKEIMTSKHFWIVVLVDVFFWNAGMNSGAFLLWLKSLKKYDSPTVNSYGSIPSAIGIFLVLFVNFSSDLVWGPVWGITFASSMNTLSNLILVSPLPRCHCPNCYNKLTDGLDSSYGTSPTAQSGSPIAVSAGATLSRAVSTDGSTTFSATLPKRDLSLWCSSTSWRNLLQRGRTS
jgi:hypothetical protein